MTVRKNFFLESESESMVAVVALEDIFNFIIQTLLFGKEKSSILKNEGIQNF
jgi:hypothetical protein